MTPKQASDRCYALYAANPAAAKRYVFMYCSTVAKSVDDVAIFVGELVAAIGADRVATTIQVAA